MNYLHYYPIISHGEVIQWIAVFWREEPHHVNLVYSTSFSSLPELYNLCSSMDIGKENIYVIDYYYSGLYGLTEDKVIDLSDMSEVTEGRILQDYSTIIASIQSAYPNCGFTSIKDFYNPENMHMAVRFYEGVELPDKNAGEIPAETAYQRIGESFYNDFDFPNHYRDLYPDDFCDMYVDYRENETKCVVVIENVNDEAAVNYYETIAGEYADTLEFSEGDVTVNNIYEKLVPEIVEFGLVHAELGWHDRKEIECTYHWDSYYKLLEVVIEAGNDDKVFALIKTHFEDAEKDYGITIVPMSTPIGTEESKYVNGE